MLSGLSKECIDATNCFYFYFEHVIIPLEVASYDGLVLATAIDIAWSDCYIDLKLSETIGKY